MSRLSVLIPARREAWLQRTVEDVLEHAIRPDTDVIVTLDGDWPDPGLPQHPRVTVLYEPQPIGQRAAVNRAARISTADLVMKLDAHCSVAPGFDAALVEAHATLGDDVLQVPAQRHLHVFDWVCTRGCGWRAYQGPTPAACPSCGAPPAREVLWRAKPSPVTTCWRFDADLHFQYWREGQKRQVGDYPETLSLLGACWCLSRQEFLEHYDGLDEGHGSWGQMGTELALKAWLGGGRVVCNRRTWFAHLFRTQGGDFSFPYPLTQREVETAREYSRRLWLGTGWAKQVQTLDALLEQFAPVPGWPARRVENAGDGLVERALLGDATAEASPSPAAAAPAPVGPRAGVLYYSDSRAGAALLKACRRQLRHAAAGLPIVAVTLPRYPVDNVLGAQGVVSIDGGPGDTFAGMRHVVLPLERGPLAMARQILTGLELLDVDVVFFCEHDCLYPPEYFDFRPASADAYYYAGHTWKVDAATGRALHYRCEQLSGLCADRRLLLAHFRRRVEVLERDGFTRRLGFEPGKPIRHGGLDDVPRATWWNRQPIVDIRHRDNLTPSRWRREQFRNPRYTAGWTEADAVPGWGTTAGRFDAWLEEVTTHGSTR